jgi:PDZ domain-containing protein
MSLRFSRTPRLVKLLLVLALTVPLVIPVNFVLIYPGEGTPLFPKMLTVTNSHKSQDFPQIYKAHGQMYLLSIWVTNPETRIFGAQVIQCWIKKDCVVIPRSVIYTKNTNNAAQMKTGKIEMVHSQSAALIATKKLFKKYYPEINLKNVDNSSLKISIENTGGPSGGLIFALGLSEILSPDDLLQGRKIASTGTISGDGTVGSIGGVEEKIVAARDEGVSLIFVPKANCNEIPKKVTGVGVIAVSTLDEAFARLQMAKGSNFQGVQGCTNLNP